MESTVCEYHDEDWLLKFVFQKITNSKRNPKSRADLEFYVNDGSGGRDWSMLMVGHQITLQYALEKALENVLQSEYPDLIVQEPSTPKASWNILCSSAFW